MGVVISLEERRRAVTGKPAPPRGVAHAELFFDLGDPFSYLAAERVERWLRGFAMARKRAGNAEALGIDGGPTPGNRG